MCLADGSGSFIPPAAIVEFARRCSWVERFMVGPTVAVQDASAKGLATGDAGVSDGSSAVATVAHVEIVPWGWNRTLRDRLLREGVPVEQLPDDAQLDFIREYSRRELAVELHKNLCAESLHCCTGEVGQGKPGGSFQRLSDRRGCIVSSSYRTVAHTMEEIEKFLQEKGRVVLKAPLSGSGKGVRFVSGELMETDRGWCKRTLQRQGAVIVEQRIEIIKEFAMLFEVGSVGETGNSQVKFRGYSLFYATNGAYKGNLLASNEYIEKVLGEFVAVEELRQTQEAIRAFLQKKLQGKYRGFVGVDQFVAEAADGGKAADGAEAQVAAVNDHAAEVAGADGAEDLSGRKFCWNPAMEINLRMTMGLVARNIYDYHAAEYGLDEATHCFEPERGIFKCG